ncbi:uncharacterized protein PHALS_03022 [Plasmopara halstedii]|uniref:Mediator complex subunit 15 KIX domain-containing protein n=1 Tax=Plasmopara halstedii TaxID=4781 RepID=A0A0P1A873_PLAHL|nr:uncharacterized protein PHALS_03022 [Plasmopara halstedii]CEG36473.1 hypothetical protein PHALS_03022 [Plasmopara halstedii]|eukprot:XP_024572842.1 hypothetical protein PHALS_03022 [Plasmopara halstedii]
MDPHSMVIQGNGISMPMSMGMGATNPQAMGLGPQTIYNQQSTMMMNAMPMSSVGMTQLNSNVVNPAQVSDWRIQLTREHRANLIAKIYNEMVRVSADPMPGIKLWMNVSWFELSLYKESPTQEVYINKIFTRLKSLRAQQSDMNAAMAAQGLPNQVKAETITSGNSAIEYWQQHAALRAKHQGDVEKVHNAFKKYVDHMKGHDETEQKKKLRYLLSYVELCANILSEDKTTHPPRKIEELDKARW